MPLLPNIAPSHATSVVETLTSLQEMRLQF